jgi:hypothetical protein
MKKTTLMGMTIAAALFATNVSATPFTRTSPTSEGLAPAGVTEIGGIVIDMIGANGTRVVSQLAASTLFSGFAGTNPLVIGTQTGFTPTVVGALGGGLAEFALRVTLYDGDTAPGNFDANQNFLLIDGVNLGDWTGIATQETTANGLSLISSGTGFGNNDLDTGWFYSTDSGKLASIYAGLADGALAIALHDVDPGDNFYDFTQGVDGGLIDVGTGPTVTNDVPEPGTLALFGLGIAGLGFARRRKTA